MDRNSGAGQNLHCRGDTATVCRADGAPEAGATASSLVADGFDRVGAPSLGRSTKLTGTACEVLGTDRRYRDHHNFLIVPHCTLFVGIAICGERGGMR